MNQKILVTGGASGLGKSITEELASESGNKVYFTYNRSADAAGEIESEYKNAVGIKCDFSNADDLAKLNKQIVDLDIDILINNAFPGDIVQQYFHKIESKAFVDAFTQTVFPVIAITQQAITLFRKKKRGKIITILSSAIINKPPIGWSEYVASKNYLLSLSKSWAVENAAFNITSNCISPSFMETRLTRSTDERILEEMIAKHPLKKLLSTDEVAQAVHYLVGASQQVNGTNMIINAAENIG